MNKQAIDALLQKINRAMGITIVVVTHQMEVVKQICSRVAFLYHGSVLAEGPPEEMFIKPAQKEIQSFLRDKSERLPKTGVNIQVFFVGESSKEPVITQMARELGKDFSICWAKLEDFRENVYGSLVLNVDEMDRETVCRFLTAKNVTWEVLE